jgi:hypothetical protein
MGKVLQLRSKSNGDEGPAEWFEREVAAVLPSGASFEERELLTLRLANELVRHSLEAELKRMAQAQPEQLAINGLLYRRHQAGLGSYPSLCGPLKVMRWTYRVVGVRNGATVVPLELEAGLIEGATPQLARCVAQGYAKAPIRSLEQDLVAACRQPPSRCTLERMAVAIGTQVKKVAVRLEQQLRAEEVIPDGVTAINLGLDRTSIPMYEDEPREGKVRRVLRYRMGYVGTVTLTDAAGQSLLVRRYASPAHVAPERVLERMMADLRRAREQKPQLRIAVVQDGAAELWNLMRDALQAELKTPPFSIRWHETIDRYHLMHHLAEGLELLVPNSRARKRIFDRWQHQLDVDNRAIERIHRWFNRTATKRNRWWKMLEIVGRYISDHRMFRYARARKLGLHQSSGVTEGACKSLITKRTKRSGQRWRPRGIAAVLALKSILESDRLDRFWPLLAARYVATPLAA